MDAPPTTDCSWGICDGTDDRVPSTDPRAARVRFTRNTQPYDHIWCSAFLFNDHPNCLITAGHCCADICWPDDQECSAGGLFTPVIEFNVPPSYSDCTPRPPARPHDQYPVGQGTELYDSGTIGDDWCVFGVFNNTSEPQDPGDPDPPYSPLDKQGDSYVLASPVPDPTDPPQTLRLTGYGCDLTPDSTRYATQQTATGPYIGHTGTIVKHVVDSTFGNSGSAVEDEGVGVYAITTHAPQSCSENSPNSGTAVDHPDLLAAIANANNLCAHCTNPGFPDNYVLGCCAINGSCQILSDECCAEAGGLFGGPGTTCDPVACCMGDGSCQDLPVVCCITAGGSVVGMGTSCPSHANEAPKACCLPSGCCIDARPSWCNQYGVYHSEEDTCATLPGGGLCAMPFP